MDQERFDIPFEGNRIMADARIDGSMESEEDICVEGVILWQCVRSKTGGD